jgi:glycosyltransferase involved in cell wall biosynthesis
MQLQHKVLFLTLRTFSGTGGIEKVSKVAGKALFENCEEQGDDLQVFCMYDQTTNADNRYFPLENFKGFGIKKWRFMAHSIWYGRKCELVVLSHINLLAAGYLIKLISPKTKLILLAHGIEVFETFSWLKRRMLRQCDQIVAVSKFTKDTLVDQKILPEAQFKVLNNCVDPFLEPPVEGQKSAALLARYGFHKDDIILMTLGRLSSDEGYKGYDMVIESLGELQETYPQLKYMMVGKYDEREKKRVDHLIDFFDVKGRVVFAGFIPDAELAAHFQLADIFIMPSEKEGFGIAFIEAMYYSKPVIAGNKDGSVDALLNGQLGLLVNPASKQEVLMAIEKIITNRQNFLPDRNLLMEHFSYEVYKEKWSEVLKKVLAYEEKVLPIATETTILSGTTNNQQLPSGKCPMPSTPAVLESGLSR